MTDIKIRSCSPLPHDLSLEVLVHLYRRLQGWWPSGVGDPGKRRRRRSCDGPKQAVSSFMRQCAGIGGDALGPSEPVFQQAVVFHAVSILENRRGRRLGAA